MDDRGERLAQLIEENPEDFDAYRAYGDWLEEQGDPRAQLMGMQLLKDRLTDRNKLDHLVAKLEAFFEEHREHFLGKLANVMPKPTSSRQLRDGATKLEWRWGFVYKVECRRFGRLTIDKFLDRLFAHPSARFVVELSTGWLEDPAATVAVLAKRAPWSLRRLHFSGSTDVGAWWPRLARLHELEINASGYGAIVAPELRRLVIHLHEPGALESFAGARWPKLEHVGLSFSKQSAEQVAAAFGQGQLPAFRSLALDCREELPQLLTLLHELPVGKQLAELELRHFDDEVASILTWFDLEVLKLREGVEEARARGLAKHVERVD